MKILLWAINGAGTHFWGPGTSAFRLYRENKDPSIKITLIHTSDKQGIFPDVFEEQIKLPSPGLGVAGIFKQLIYHWKAYQWIKNNYHKYDVVHGLGAYEHTFRPLLQFASNNIPAFIKIPIKYGGLGNNSKVSNAFGFANRRIQNANKINGYIAISEKIKKNLLQNNVVEESIHKIPNGVDISRFHPVSKIRKVELRKQVDIPDKFTFLYVGGLSYRKRIIETIKGIIPIIKDEDNIQFLIVGPDRSNKKVYSEIRGLIKKYDLQKEIILIPMTEKPELYYQISDVFTLVSKSEGMSNSLLEAMASGLPALVTDISGSQDLIQENKNGIFTNGTPDDIEDKLRWFLLNKDVLEDYGTFSRKLIVNNYSHEIVLEKHLELFKSSINT